VYIVDGFPRLATRALPIPILGLACDELALACDELGLASDEQAAIASRQTSPSTAAAAPIAMGFVGRLRIMLRARPPRQ